MKTPAIIASLTVVGSIAFAAGQQAMPMQPSRMMAPANPRAAEFVDARPDGSAHRESASPSNRFIGECDLPSNPWFDPQPIRLLNCDGTTMRRSLAEYIGVSSLGCADVNSDGSEESFFCQFGGATFPSGSEAATYLVRRLPSANAAGGTQLRGERVLRIDTSLAPFVEQIFADLPIEFGGIEPIGWTDIDGDKDLDLVCKVKVHYDDPELGNPVNEVDFIWFRNTGFQHTNQFAADLNHDGKVDGADLGLLLTAWGTTQ
jgi:hypothetical protein